MSKHEIFFKVVDSNVVSFLLQHELLAQIAPEGIGAFHLDNWLCPPAPCLSCSFSRPCNTVCYKEDSDAQIETSKYIIQMRDSKSTGYQRQLRLG